MSRFLKCAIFDAHFHVIDPRFPLVPNQGYLPRAVHGRRLPRAVSRPRAAARSCPAPSRPTTRRYLVDALQRLGPAFVGVAQVPPDDHRRRGAARCDAAGVRAFRANFHRGTAPDGLAGPRPAPPRARGLAPRGLRRPARPAARCRAPRLVIDHLGGPRGRAAGTAAPRRARRAREGHRASARSTTTSPPRCARSSPPTRRALLFGTDLPARAPRGRSSRATSSSSREIAGERALPRAVGERRERYISGMVREIEPGDPTRRRGAASSCGRTSRRSRRSRRGSTTSARRLPDRGVARG